MHMFFERGHVHRILVLFIALWVALAIMGGVLNKTGAEPGYGASSDGSAIQIALKTCAVIFTAVAVAAGGVSRKLWRVLPVARAGIRRYALTRLIDRYRPPPHGFSLLRALHVIIV